MGEIADLIINGGMCQFCGEVFEVEAGFPTVCGSCESSDDDDIDLANCTTKDGKPIYRPGKVNCDICNKLVKITGLDAHKKAKHDENIHNVRSGSQAPN